MFVKIPGYTKISKEISKMDIRSKLKNVLIFITNNKIVKAMIKFMREDFCMVKNTPKIRIENITPFKNKFNLSLKKQQTIAIPTPEPKTVMFPKDEG